MPKIPQSIGPFKILGSLGRGGTSQVYKALHPTLKRTVVLKKLTIKGSGPVRERFRREADLMMGFNHHHIVKVYDIFKEGSSWIIVQEYVDGPNLEEVVASRGGLGRAASLKVIVQCLKALTYIHKQGIIHRDIKPSNIFLTAKGQVKLGDFGIASRLEGGKALTREGAALGTPDFMAPEQVLNPSKVDGRADIYSLALTWYEAWTGTPYPRRGRLSTAVRFSWTGFLLRRGASKTRFLRFISTRSMLWQIRLTLFPLLLSKQTASDHKEEARRSRRNLILLPLVLLALFGGRFLYYGVVKRGVYGTFRLEIPYSEGTASWYLKGAKASLYRQEGEDYRSKRPLWLINYRKKDELRTGTIYLSTGSYALQLSLVDREKWVSFFMTPEGDVIRLDTLDSPPTVVAIETRVYDVLTGVALDDAKVTVSSEGGSLKMFTGQTKTLRFSCPGYRPLEREYHAAEYLELLTLEVGLLPEPALLTIQFAEDPVTSGLSNPVRIDGLTNFLSWEGDPHWQKVLIENRRTQLTLPPKSYTLEIDFAGETRTVEVNLKRGEKRTIYVE